MSIPFAKLFLKSLNQGELKDMLGNLFLKNNSDRITKATKKTRKREVIILSIIIYIIYNILYKFKTDPHSQLSQAQERSSTPHSNINRQRFAFLTLVLLPSLLPNPNLNCQNLLYNLLLSFLVLSVCRSVVRCLAYAYACTRVRVRYLNSFVI